MTRRDWLALKIAAWMMFLLAIACGPFTTSADQPMAYAPLPTSAFSPWLIAPLERPIRTPELRATEKPSPTHAPRVSPRPPRTIHPTHSARGIATFYPYHQGQAAAAQRLRDAIGPSWRGTVVQVWYAGRPPLTVVLTDFESSKIPGRLIDLDDADFATLAGPGWYQRGVLSLRVTW